MTTEEKRPVVATVARRWIAPENRRSGERGYGYGYVESITQEEHNVGSD